MNWKQWDLEVLARKQKIKFAVPNGVFGSGLTIITGPNNSGKSTIVESLNYYESRNNPSFTVGSRNSKVNKIELIYKFNNTINKIESISRGSSETKKTMI